MTNASEAGIKIKDNSYQCPGCGYLKINHELEDSMVCQKCGTKFDCNEKTKYPLELK